MPAGSHAGDHGAVIFEMVLGGGENASNASLSMNAAEIFGLFDLKARAGKGTKKIGPEPEPKAA